MKEINNEKNNKLLAARDVILAYLMKEDFTIEETEAVLQMCTDEINAAIKRQKFGKVRKEDFPVGENVCGEQTKGARPGGEDNG